jgi:hypothetical protein
MNRTPHPLNPAVDRIINAARRLVRTADEFWPEYPEAIGEDLEALGDAFDHYGREADALPVIGLDDEQDNHA